MKRKLFIRVLLCMLLCFAALCGQAEELSNADYKYTIMDGQVTITRYLGAGGTVTIPGYIDGLPVTTIGEAAFQHLSSKKITHVTIPDTVTVIEDRAFCEMWTLESVTFPRNLKTIGVSAFYNNLLTNVSLPESVTSLGSMAFYANKKLEELHLPDGITEMGTEVANASTKIYCGTYSDTAKNMTDHPFADPDAPHLFLQYRADGGLAVVDYTGAQSSVRIPEGVTEIAREAFQGAIYTNSITIPESVTTIGAAAFESCRNLKSITLPNSITSIGGSAFLGCTALRDVKLPAGNVTYGSNIFGDCTGLRSVVFPEGNTMIGDTMFRYCTALSSVTIPDSLTSIGHNAFHGCKSLTGITLLDNITSLGAMCSSMRTT